MKTPSGCEECSSLMEWYRTFRASLEFVLGGMYAAVKMITVNSQGSGCHGRWKMFAEEQN